LLNNNQFSELVVTQMSKHSLVPNEYKGTEAKLVEQISQASEIRFSLTKEYT
jgi:hypothetical protein